MQVAGRIEDSHRGKGSGGEKGSRAGNQAGCGTGEEAEHL